MTFSVQRTYASVPKVHSMGMRRAGSNVIVRIEIAHFGRSESHYVDIVEATMDGKSLNITDLEPQTSYRFYVNGTYNNTEIGDLRVRAHCVTHGWSNWTQISRLSSSVVSANSNETAVKTMPPKRPREPTWYPLVVPLAMMSLLVLMKWRKMLP